MAKTKTSALKSAEKAEVLAAATEDMNRIDFNTPSALASQEEQVVEALQEQA